MAARSFVKGAIVMSPCISRCRRRASSGTTLGTSEGANPYWVGSPEVFT